MQALNMEFDDMDDLTPENEEEIKEIEYKTLPELKR